MKAFPSRGLYAITQTENKSPAIICHEVIEAILGGAVVIQYRDKNPSNSDSLAIELVNICHHHNVPLIINDDIELAIRSGADGVHLGKDDGNITEARTRLGQTAIIGISCYNDLDRAINAQDTGASYVAFGRFFPSNSKPLAAPASINTLQQAKQTLHVPIVAIGGILPDNAGELLSAGADLVAVIGGIFDHNPRRAALAYQGLFSQ
jgi:thiamine-phosphate pyrophosphorylase